MNHLDNYCIVTCISMHYINAVITLKINIQQQYDSHWTWSKTGKHPSLLFGSKLGLSRILDSISSGHHMHGFTDFHQPNFISRNLNTTHQSVMRWILSEQNFASFPVTGRFSKKHTKNSQFFQHLATSGHHNPAMIIDRWNFITVPNDPSTGCLVSIFTVGINSKSFRWPLHSIRQTSPKFSVTSDAGWRNLWLSKWAWPNDVISQSQAASDDWLLSHMTLGCIECRK